MNIKHFAAVLALLFALSANSAPLMADEDEHGDHGRYEQQDKDSHYDNERDDEHESEGKRGEHENKSISHSHESQSGHTNSTRQKARTFVDILGDLLSF